MKLPHPTAGRTPMPDEEILASEIGSIMLQSNCFTNLDAQEWEASHDKFIAKMVNRFSSDYPHDVIRRVAEVEFEIGSEIIKVRDSFY
jgi:hypothetical protein